MDLSKLFNINKSIDINYSNISTMHRHEHSHYKPARFHFTEAQIKKIHKGHKVRLGHHQIGKGPHTLFLHPVQHQKVSQAHAKGKGIDLSISDGELMHSINSGVEGTGIWDTIKSGFNKYVKPVLSGVGDAIAYANPELAPLREGVRGLTGVGLMHHHKKAHKKAHKKHKKHYESDSSSSSESEEEHHHKKHRKKAHKKHSKRGSGLYL